MIPIRDDNPRLTFPYATYLIISINVVAWVFLQGLGSEGSLHNSVCQFGLTPANLFAYKSDIEYAGCATSSELGLLAVFTSMFMHGSWLHIIGNMWFLWVFADNVEDSMGSVRFALFYTLCGITAAAAQVVTNPASVVPMVGASGAIGGVMGAYIVLYPRVRVHMFVFIFIFVTTFYLPAYAMLGYWVVVQLVGGISSYASSGGGIAFWAHVGGFAAGAVMVFVFKDEQLLVGHPHRGWVEREDPAAVWNNPDNQQ